MPAFLILIALVVMVLSISVHDCAQAWMANRQGDPTARMLGRITMNPVAHFDPFGTALAPLLAIFLFHNSLPYGWGKPVPMTYRNFRGKNGELVAVTAGPAAQFLAAVAALLVMVVLKHAAPGARESIAFVGLVARGAPVVGLDQAPAVFPVLVILYFCIMVNLLLFAFNLLPMPFLDGGKVLLHFLPYNAQQAFARYSMFFVLAFFLVGGILVNIVFVPLLALFEALLRAL